MTRRQVKGNAQTKYTDNDYKTRAWKKQNMTQDINQIQETQKPDTRTQHKQES